MSTPVCEFPKCCCTPEPGDTRCKVHRDFVLATTEYCSKCQAKVRAGTWARKNRFGVEHIGACPKVLRGNVPAPPTVQ